MHPIRCCFLGYRSDVPKLLKAADLFVFPTYYEGQPFALLEAMAYNVPIVTTSTDGIPELIQHKMHGLLTKKGDSTDMLESIRWAMRNDDKMTQMAQMASIKVKEFSKENMLRQTLELMNEMVNKKEKLDLDKFFLNTN